MMILLPTKVEAQHVKLKCHGVNQYNICSKTGKLAAGLTTADVE